MNRRDVLNAMAGMAIAATAKGQTDSNGMIYREFGQSGEKVSAIGLGGHHIGRPKDPNDGIQIIAVRSIVGSTSWTTAGTTTTAKVSAEWALPFVTAIARRFS